MNTLFIGRNVIELDSIDSTNSYANDLLKEGNLPEGTIIWTKNQTQGRGQRGNAWESQPSMNLALSLVLNPVLLVSQQFYLNKIISLAVADFVADILKEITPFGGITETKSFVESKRQVSVKWPNDIYVDNKKIAGILIENSVRNNQIVHSVVGIGININQEKFSNSILNPTSLKMICHEGFDIEKCLLKLCSFIESRYLILKSDRLEKLDELYKHILYRYGEWADFRIGEKVAEARIIDVSKEGKLVVETADKRRSSYGFKEIIFC